MEQDGIYPFFTCAEQPFRINSYAFDCDALLISGNGANVGYIHHYKGMFNAYQRTYVLMDFKKNIMFVMAYLQEYLKRRIDASKNTGNTPYIVMETLSEMKIHFPSEKEQNKIIRVLSILIAKIEIEQNLYHNYEQQKQYLLSAMFI